MNVLQEFLSEMRKQSQGDGKTPVLLTGTVISVQDDNNCTVRLGSDATTDVPGVKSLSSYKPVVNDVVRLLGKLPDVWIAGKLGAYVLPPPDVGRFGQMEPHSTVTDFNNITQWGWTFVQGSANGPNLPGGNGQYYVQTLSLGSEYPLDGAGSYAMQIAYPRNSGDGKYAIRFKENNVWGAWRTVYGRDIQHGDSSAHYYGPNATWGAYLYVGSGTHPGDMVKRASVLATDGNLHIDAGNGKILYLNFYDGSRIVFGNGANGDTGSYVDSNGSISGVMYDKGRRLVWQGQIGGGANIEYSGRYLDGSTLNQYMGEGRYNCVNMPTNPFGDGRWFWVDVYQHVSGAHWQKQVFHDMTGGQTIWDRRCTGGDPTVASSWTGWRQLH